MRVKEALEFARESLHVNNPAKEARVLLSAFLDKPTEWLVLNEKEEIPSFEYFKEWVFRRKNDEPLEYITQKVSFYSRDFFISEGVLIPRPETELLVDLVCAKIQNIKNPKVLEIGVGSGVISIMLALLNPDIRISATDISVRALEVAYKNAVDFGVDKRIDFCFCSYEEDVSGDFDLLVSNPPYIANGTILEPHVLREPHQALFGGKVGHEFLEKLVLITKKRGIKNLACEMGYDQMGIMSEILRKNGVKEFEFYKDLSFIDRGFIAKF